MNNATRTFTTTIFPATGSTTTGTANTATSHSYSENGFFTAQNASLATRLQNNVLTQADKLTISTALELLNASMEQQVLTEKDTLRQTREWLLVEQHESQLKIQKSKPRQEK